jgi:transposase-like protein
MGKRGKVPSFGHVFCPNSDCKYFQKTGMGNVVANGKYSTRSGVVRKYICRGCGRVFNDRTGTVFFDLRTSDEKVLMALKLLLKGMSVRGIAEVLGSKPDTVLRWLGRAAEHSEQVNNWLLRDLKIGRVELDELWSFVEKKQLRQWQSKRARSGFG